jgi:prepilin-type N-terminal cleavage/methylation domain-containing protein
MTAHAKSNRRGFGLTEVVASTAIVGVMIVAALNSAWMVARTQRLNADRLTGPGLARDLLAEIMSMPYEDPQNPGGANGVDSGESSGTRSTFDDVDDYNGWSSSNGVSRAGTARTGYTGWSHAVTVTWAERATGTAYLVSDTNLKRITVTVTSPTATVTQLVGLRSRYGALEQTLPIAAAPVGWLGLELRTGSGTQSWYSAAPLVNLTSEPD